jgi:hypothetical protein
MLIKNVTVLIDRGCDRITITLDNKDAFPNLCYDTVLHIETQKGVGVQWCKLYMGINPEVISTRHGVVEKGEELKDRNIVFMNGHTSLRKYVDEYSNVE